MVEVNFVSVFFFENSLLVLCSFLRIQLGINTGCIWGSVLITDLYIDFPRQFYGYNSWRRMVERQGLGIFLLRVVFG